MMEKGNSHLATVILKSVINLLSSLKSFIKLFSAGSCHSRRSEMNALEKESHLLFLSERSQLRHFDSGGEN